MTEHITLLSIVAFAASLMVVTWAVYTWLTYFHQLALSRSLLGDVQSLEAGLLQTVESRVEYLRSMARIKRAAESDDSPWCVTLKRTIGQRLTRDECRRYLLEDIEKKYSSLTRQASLLKGVAPSIGLLFTVLGLIFVMFKQSAGLDHRQMLGDIGVALITTGVSSFVLILQVTLLSLLSSLMDREYDASMSLIDTLLETRKALPTGRKSS